MEGDGTGCGGCPGAGVAGLMTGVVEELDCDKFNESGKGSFSIPAEV